MGTFETILCFGALFIIALIAFAVFNGFNRRRSNAPMSSIGNESPRYDDPSVLSGGSFGGASPSNPGPRASNPSRGITLGEDNPRHDDPNVRSGGSFGG